MALVAEQALVALAADALAGCGLERTDAEDAARILVLGDLFGVHTHGVARIESYAERIRLGGIKARPDIRVEHAAPGIVKVDGDNGLGPLVGMRALQAALSAASETGIGAAFVRASNHFGPVVPYNHLAAEQGFASIIGSNATTTIAPTGGSEARLGNSPVGFAVPNPAGPPIILDMAVSVVARAKIRRPRSTVSCSRSAATRATASRSSSISSPACSRARGISRASRRGRTIPSERNPARPVLLPGEIEWKRMQRQRQHGIEIDDAVLRKLASLTGTPSSASRTRNA